MPTLHEALTTSLEIAAARLGLALGFEGEAFMVPPGLHMRGRVVFEGQAAASCGSFGLTRVDGYLEAVVVDAAGSGDAPLRHMAGQLCNLYPRGGGVASDEGEAVFATPQIRAVEPHGARLRLPVRLPFYALLSGGQ